MSHQSLNIDEVVDFVIESQKHLGDGGELVSAVISRGMTSEQAEQVIGAVRDAYGRFVLMSTGMKAQQFRGDLESDPIFQTALKRFLASAPPRMSESAPRAVEQGRLSPIALVGIVLGGLILLCGIVTFLVQAIQWFRG